jgi:hypothetical protein
MYIFILEKIRKIFKSIGKLENKIIDNIINKTDKIEKQFVLKDYHFKKVLEKKYKPKKIAIVICFYFKKSRFKTLNKNILEIASYNFNTDLTLITNDLTKKDELKLKKIIKKIKKYSIIKFKDLPDKNFLPWHSLGVMKSKIKDSSYSHFMYLEDDIIVNSKNISYWIYFRKILKKINLIPNFIRCETYKGKLFSVDNPKKLKKNKNPIIFTENKKFGFINSKYPYSAMYLMDRELLKNFLKSKATKIDFSFTNRVMKSLYPIKELVNISYAYLDVPKRYHNRLVLPFIKNTIPEFCIIKHNDLKYVKHKSLNKMGYGTINIENLIT